MPRSCYGTMYDHSENWIKKYCMTCPTNTFNKCKIISPDPNPPPDRIPEEKSEIKEPKSKW